MQVSATGEDARGGEVVERGEHGREGLVHLRRRLAALALVLSLGGCVVVDRLRDLVVGEDLPRRVVVEGELQLSAALPLLPALPVVAAGLVVDDADAPCAFGDVDAVDLAAEGDRPASAQWYLDGFEFLFEGLRDEAVIGRLDLVAQHLLDVASQADADRVEEGGIHDAAFLCEAGEILVHQGSDSLGQLVGCIRCEGELVLLLELSEEPVGHRVIERAEVLGLGLVGALGLFPRAEPEAGLQEVAVRAAGEGLDDARGRSLPREAQPRDRFI